MKAGRIALVQNRSEMVHYSYADFRPVLDTLGYEYDLFTSTNIHQLDDILRRNEHDAIVIGSNALHDQAIAAALADPEIRSQIERNVTLGCGLLFLMQYRFAGAGIPIPTLLSEYGEFKPVARPGHPSGESAAEGDLVFSDLVGGSSLLAYPETIDASHLANELKGHPSLQALYWHWWDDLNPALWDIVIRGRVGSDNRRPLLAVSKHVDRSRVVLCSMPIDWQKPASLCANVLSFVTSGVPRTALVSNPSANAFSFQYLRQMLRSRRIAMSEYVLAPSMPNLVRNLTSGVHRVIILGPNLGDQIPGELRESMSAKVADGSLTLLSFDAGGSAISSFSIAGREREALSYLTKSITVVRATLGSEFIDKSFWATIETLQCLERLRRKFGQKGLNTDRILDLAKAHDQGGSYDQVFGVTVALAWLRGTYLDRNHPDLTATISWLRARLKKQDTIDQVAALKVFNDVGVIQPEEIEAANQSVRALRLASLTEIQLLFLLENSIGFLSPANSLSVLTELVERLNSGDSAFSSDIPLSASLVTVLLQAKTELGKQDSVPPALWSEIDKIVFRLVIQIQGHPTVTRSANVDGPWWDGKWSTALKCLEAWIRFDDLLDLPVYECARAVRNFQDETEARRVAGRDLEIFQNLSDQIGALQTEVSTFKSSSEGNAERARHAGSIALRNVALGRIAAFVALAMTYAFVTLLVSSYQKVPDRFSDVVAFAIGDLWGQHLAFLGVIMAALAVPWFGRRRKRIAKSSP